MTHPLENFLPKAVPPEAAAAIYQAFGFTPKELPIYYSAGAAITELVVTEGEGKEPFLATLTPLGGKVGITLLRLDQKTLLYLQAQLIQTQAKG